MTNAALAMLVLATLAEAAAVSPGRGIPRTLATERAAGIRALRYELSFRIPDSKAEVVRGVETVRFELRAARPVVLDFEQKRERIVSVEAGEKAVAFDFVDGHIIVPATATRAGENAIRIEFLAGDESLNRNDEFLYTLFVPARAHYAFPCFDQPSLKARYSLTLDIPAAWQATANGAETGRETANGRAVVRFAETQPLPTYLFSFAAGKFQVETAERNGRTFRDRRGDRARNGKRPRGCAVRRNPAFAHLPVLLRRGQVPGGDGRAQRTHIPYVPPRNGRREGGSQPRRHIRPARARPGVAGRVHGDPVPVGQVRFRADPLVPVRRYGTRGRHPL